MKLPPGFKFAGVAASIKPSGKRDVALFVSEQECVAAGVYTQNLVRASSIDWNRAITPSDSLRAVVVNSGNANACTGDEGSTNNRQMAELTAGALQANSKQVMVLSTGVIGHQLPMTKVEEGINQAANDLGDDNTSFENATEAIQTTDKFSKVGYRSFRCENGKEVIISGVAKGAGMIGPNMATMLGVLCTNAKLNSEQAQRQLANAVGQSFNRISVEGHTSTNDAVILMSCQSESDAVDLNEEESSQFESALTELCIELAKKIPMDGEGATHLISIKVSGAKTDQEADQIARCVANSNLVKTAVTGNDPNWGRIVSAVGYCPGVELNPNEMNLTLNNVSLFESGTPVEFDESAVSQSMRESSETQIDLAVGQGPGVAQHWTSDLTVDYVRFNSEYTT